MTSVQLRITVAALTAVVIFPPVARGQAGSRMNEVTAAEAKAGWVSLFDGKTLNGWTTIGGIRWSVVDGAISADPASQPVTPTGDSKQTWPQGFLRSTATFADFELTAEFWSAEDTNSGLFIRCAQPANPGSLGSCYEINISDPHATTPTGGIVGVHSSLPYRVKSAGKWSRFDVLADGPHLVVKVNNETLTDVRDEKLKDGAIGLQAGGPTGSGPIKFRNIKLRPLSVAKIAKRPRVRRSRSG